jgi:hypothetical protein
VLGQAITADKEAAHEVRARTSARAQYCRDHMLFLDGGTGQQHAFDKVCQLMCSLHFVIQGTRLSQDNTVAFQMSLSRSQMRGRRVSPCI